MAYVLYMYQVEDIIRSYGLDMDRIGKEFLPHYEYDDEQLDEAYGWWEGLVRMMNEEGCQERGHVQVVKNTIFLLTDRHKELLADDKMPFYSAAYYKALPFIVELRSKGDGRKKQELETCLDAVYGLTLLKMQNKEISTETKTAISAISHLLNMLAENYEEKPE